MQLQFHNYYFGFGTFEYILDFPTKFPTNFLPNNSRFRRWHPFHIRLRSRHGRGIEESSLAHSRHLIGTFGMKCEKRQLQRKLGQSNWLSLPMHLHHRLQYRNRRSKLLQHLRRWKHRFHPGRCMGNLLPYQFPCYHECMWIPDPSILRCIQNYPNFGSSLRDFVRIMKPNFPSSWTIDPRGRRRLKRPNTIHIVPGPWSGSPRPPCANQRSFASSSSPQ